MFSCLFIILCLPFFSLLLGLTTSTFPFLLLSTIFYLYLINSTSTLPISTTTKSNSTTYLTPVPTPVQGLRPTEHKCHLQCAIYYTFKKCGYIGCPKKRHSRPTSSKAEKHAKPPQSPHPKRSPGQPRPRDRDRSNQARHTNPSAALMHLPTSSTPKP